MPLNFFTFIELLFKKKFKFKIEKIVSSITHKIHKYDMKYWYKTISKIGKILFIFQNFEFFFTSVKNWYNL